MTKKEIKLIGSKLGWEYQETEEAIKKLLKERSIIKDWRKYFNICLGYTNPEDRWINIRELLKDQIGDEDIVELICECSYSPDPCFAVWALFNISDKKKECRNSYFWWRELQRRRSFHIGFSTKSIPGLFYSNPLFDPNDLLDHFLSYLIGGEGFKRSQSILLQVAERVGFSAFRISAFRSQALWYDFDPVLYKFAKKLIGALNNKYVKKLETTEKEYWLWYLLVEKLKGDYGFKEACRKIGKYFYKKNNSIERRYFEQKNEAIKLGWSDNDILAEYDLILPLEKYVSEIVSN